MSQPKSGLVECLDYPVNMLSKEQLQIQHVICFLCVCPSPFVLESASLNFAVSLDLGTTECPRWS